MALLRGERDCGVVQSLLMGNLDGENRHPCQSVNYLESHDDYSLVDRFRDLYQFKEGCPLPPEVKRLATLAGASTACTRSTYAKCGTGLPTAQTGVRNTYLRVI